MIETSLPDAALDRVAVLADPVRRNLYRFVAGQPEGAGRDAAATAVGISRALAAFHLDRLADAGLLEVGYRRLGARRGPGAGRPAKIYRRAAGEVAVTLPDRRYETAADLFASAIERGRATAGATGDSAAAPGDDDAAGLDPVSAEARELGLSIGSDARRRAGRRPGRARLLEAAAAVLGERGYEPVIADDGTLVLRNCPFDALAQRHRSLVCGMNLSIMDGLLDGLRARGISAVLDPQPGRCCVFLEPTRQPLA